MEHDLKKLEELIAKLLSLVQNPEPGLATWSDALVARIADLRAILSQPMHYCPIVAYNARRRYNGQSEISSTVEMTPADYQEHLYVVKAVAQYLHVDIS